MRFVGTRTEAEASVHSFEMGGFSFTPQWVREAGE